MVEPIRPQDQIARRYRRFADEEARGRSPLYEAFAHGVAEDQACLRFLETLPEVDFYVMVDHRVAQHSVVVIHGGNIDDVVIALSKQGQHPHR